MLTEIGLVIYGLGLLHAYFSTYRYEELAILPIKRIIKQGAAKKSFIRTENTRQFVLTQAWGMSNFEFKRLIAFGDDKKGSDEVISPQTETLETCASDNKEGLIKLLHNIGEELREGDLFYFGVTRHGTFSDDKQAALADFYDYTGRKREILALDEFVEAFSGISNSGSVNVLYFDNCLGGDFARKMGKGNNIAISSSMPGKKLIHPGRDMDLGEMINGVSDLAHRSDTRCDFEESFYKGDNLVEAFRGAKHMYTYKLGLTVVRPIINQPRMYVGDIDPSTVLLR